MVGEAILLQFESVEMILLHLWEQNRVAMNLKYTRI